MSSPRLRCQMLDIEILGLIASRYSHKTDFKPTWPSMSLASFALVKACSAVGSYRQSGFLPRCSSCYTEEAKDSVLDLVGVVEETEELLMGMFFKEPRASRVRWCGESVRRVGLRLTAGVNSHSQKKKIFGKNSPTHSFTHIITNRNTKQQKISWRANLNR